MLTQKRLKELLNYDSNTGNFTNLTNRHKAKKGKAAGFKISKGYISIVLEKIEYRAHRLAWLYVYGVWPKNQIDHENHIRDDNRISNLRCVTHQENSKNRRLGSNNSSRIIGVGWRKKDKEWRARIKVSGVLIHLGTSKSIFEAACLRRSAENKYNFHPNHGR